MTTDDAYDTLFVMYGDRYQIPWRLLKAQARAESALDPRAVSPAGAQGISQFMPPTWAEWSAKCGIKDADVFNPQHAIQCQAAYMFHLINLFDGGEQALAAYNWGMGNLRRCLDEHGHEWKDHLPDETKQYLARIQGYYEEMAK